MKQRINFITIGVKDLGKMKAFYRDIFGWNIMKDTGGIVFFKMNGLILGLFPEDELAEDIKIKNDGAGFKRISLAINFHSEKEVDEVFEELNQKGIKVMKAPEKVFWGGYSGYVSDIEDNYWELAFNPFLEMDANGNVLSHQ